MRIRPLLTTLALAGVAALGACAGSPGGPVAGPTSAGPTGTGPTSAGPTSAPAGGAVSAETKAACTKEIVASTASAQQFSLDLNEIFLAEDDAATKAAEATMINHLTAWARRLADLAAKTPEPAVGQALTQAAATVTKYTGKDSGNQPLGPMMRDVEGIAGTLTALCV